MLIGLLALCVGISTDAVALYFTIISFLEDIYMQNNNDTLVDGAVGAKVHEICQLVILNTYDTSTAGFKSSTSRH